MKRTILAFTLIELLVVIAIIGVLIALLLPAVQAAREAARRTQCAHRLMQLGVACKNFEQAHGVLPSGTVNDTGPIRNVPIGNHMGWLPRLLPYLEQTPLYEGIDFSRGVYDPENRDVWFACVPSIFHCPSDGGGGFYRRRSGSWPHYGGSSGSSSSRLEMPGLQNYVACHGGEETPIDEDNNGVFFLNGQIRSRDIPDGTASTIFFGETVILNEGEIVPRARGWHYSSSLKIILPEEGNDGTVIEETDENPFASFYGNKYDYGSLGWMSGSPGTIRNTAYPPNTYVGPFSNWPMPKEVIQRLRDERIQSNEPVEEPFNPVLPPEIWRRPLPGQLVVGGFGAYHAQVSNFLFGDGSVQSVSMHVDSKVFQAMGHRRDSKPVADP